MATTAAIAVSPSDTTKGASIFSPKQRLYHNPHLHLQTHNKIVVVAKAATTQNLNHQTSVPSDSRRQRRPQNVDGDFFVDHTCIDCDTYRWMAPETFTRVDGMSAVYKQPCSEVERLKALQALISCPTSSIRTEESPRDILDIHDTFPIPIDDNVEGVYHCGYHSVKSYGGASYLVVHPQGNILVDSPRYTERLARKIESMGGVCYMFLTHKDDTADHEKWSKRLNCKRILHADDLSDSTASVEVKLEGSGPWNLGNIGDDFMLVHTPGHTAGSVCLFYKPKKVLFSGDHLAIYDGALSILDHVNWFSIPLQIDSARKLLELSFEWILPGHGRRVAFGDVEEKNHALNVLLESKSP